jgi:hypothetical protein
LCGGFTFACGKPLKLRLCIGCEMNFKSQAYEQPWLVSSTAIAHPRPTVVPLN